ncbi:MAG: hypothetical protein E7Z70_03010 [Thermoplasmata archaeon]|nr:hypothetical protein [Thermoplasmata archaeon]
MAESSDAAGEPDLSIYRYTPRLTMTSENFGDGTVLDGRWEYYIEKQDNGETQSSDINAGISAYKALPERELADRHQAHLCAEGRSAR